MEFSWCFLSLQVISVEGGEDEQCHYSWIIRIDESYYEDFPPFLFSHCAGPHTLFKLTYGKCICTPALNATKSSPGERHSERTKESQTEKKEFMPSKKMR